MPRKKVAKKSAPRPRTRSDRPQPILSGTKGKKTLKLSEDVPTRTTRGRPGAVLVEALEDPQKIGRKPRKPRRTSPLAEHRSPSAPAQELVVQQSLEQELSPSETSDTQSYSPAYDVSSDAPVESIDADIPLLLRNKNTRELYYRRIGYVPPLDEEIIAIIEAAIFDPTIPMGINCTQKEFEPGLTWKRNVSTDESPLQDPQKDLVLTYKPKLLPHDSNEERAFLEKVWNFDLTKSLERTNEALFQRTLMMNMISRHRLFYDEETQDRNCLDFSVEETWDCPPMPSTAYKRVGDLFLTMPKPDLSVCFRRKSIYENWHWKEIPKATMLLVCPEGEGAEAQERAFPFLAIEAKRSKYVPDDRPAMLQCLNDASQALHNMYEFFKDAGPQHEQMFFEKVRFFSAAATDSGVVFRIHWATPIPKSTQEDIAKRIVPDYPLKFEYQVLCKVDQAEFKVRQLVADTFERIMLGYGKNCLFQSIRDAASSLLAKMIADPEAFEKRNEDLDFYRHGQKSPPKPIRTPKPSRRATPAGSMAPTESFASGLNNGLNNLDVNSSMGPPLGGATESRPQTATSSFLNDSMNSSFSVPANEAPGPSGASASGMSMNEPKRGQRPMAKPRTKRRRKASVSEP